MNEKNGEFKHVEFVNEDGIGIAKFRLKRLTDSVEVHSCGQELVRADAESQTRDVVVDFSGMAAVPSNIFASLVLIYKQMRRREARLRVCGLSRDALAAFNILNLHRLMTAHANLEEALSAAKSARSGEK